MASVGYNRYARNPVSERILDWLIAKAMGIRLGDGTAIESIRLGDGTAIAEVRKGDGTIVWPASAPVPASAVAQWDAQALNLNDGDRITSWSDSVGSFDLDAGNGMDYEETGINGHPSAFGDGVDDNIGVNSWPTAYSQPFTVSGVVQLQSVVGSSQNSVSWSTGSNQQAGTLYLDHSSITDIFMYSGDPGLTGPAISTNVFIFVGVLDGASSVFNVNGTEYTGNPGSRAIGTGEEMRIGSSFDGGNPAHGYVGEIVLHDSGLNSSERSDEITRLTNKWT